MRTRDSSSRTPRASEAERWPSDGGRREAADGDAARGQPQDPPPPPADAAAEQDDRDEAADARGAARRRADVPAGRHPAPDDARGVPRGDAPVPVGRVQAPPLPRHQPGDRVDQDQLPGPRAVGAQAHVRARRRRARRHHARGGRRDHEPDARAHPPGRGPRPAQAEDGLAVARRARRGAARGEASATCRERRAPATARAARRLDRRRRGVVHARHDLVAR